MYYLSLFETLKCVIGFDKWQTNYIIRCGLLCSVCMYVVCYRSAGYAVVGILKY